MSASEEDISSFSESIVKAQKEAEEATRQYEEEQSARHENEALPEVPRLLQLPQEQLVEKTHEFRSKGKQLDLLLLKAESYSHFIAENQKRSRIIAPLKSPKSAKKQASPGTKRSSPETDILFSPSKRQKDESFQQPPNLTGGQLLPYQLEGLQWLLSLWENGISGILADEMGLGKTIQVIALIAYLRHHDTPGPFLIAAPLATVPNWINEFRKWLPSCPVIMYHGSREERAALRRKHMKVANQKLISFPVVVTSYEICMIDRSYLEQYVWQYLILDEGHRIKNRNCKLVRELKSVKSVSRLLLTGTPIQNTLEELWSLLNFCSPMIFDDLRVFQAWFGFRNIGKDTHVQDIIDTEQQNRIVSKLHEILRPFLLRRMKCDVMVTLPPKQEIIVYCPLTNLQREYYLRVQQGTLRSALVAMGIEGAKDISEINMTMNLRKVCNHPFLFGEPRDESGRYLGVVQPHLLAKASGKFKLLERMLPRLQREGHKVLIFSQMTELLNILEDYINFLGYKYCRLDGSTKVEDRQRGIDLFNSDATVFAYLLSTRAGGLGVNLTGADTVILFDSDWNPHQDSQAQDRCHRIGQTRPIVVYRFLTAGSMEISMLEKQISKRKLERLTIQGGDYRIAGKRSAALTLAGLRKLLDDDVRNLSRMSSTSPNSISELISDSSAGNGKEGANAVFQDISNEELDCIMDRDRLFATYAATIETLGHADNQESGMACSAKSFDSIPSPAKHDEKTTALELGQSVHDHGLKFKKRLKSPGKSAEDRKKAFQKSSLIPTEGLMYDIVFKDEHDNVLHGVNN